MYLFETSGTLNQNDLIAPENLSSLTETLDSMGTEKLLSLIKKDYDRQDVIDFIREINATKVQQRLINELFAKALFYKEVKEFIEDRYYPPQIMSIENFNLQVAKDPQEIKTKGEISLSIKGNAYFQKPAKKQPLSPNN
jgi:hypothetical protein